MQARKVIMTSKAKTLENLKASVTRFRVPDLLYFTSDQLNSGSDQIVKAIVEYFRSADCKLAIRSSAADEDGANGAKAGEYHSVLNVPSSDAPQIAAALDAVLKSFAQNGNRVPNSDDEVIVQLMVENTAMSGVIFTHELNTGAPYYVINYDDVSGLTNTITGGEGEYANRTLYIHRSAKEDVRSDRFQVILEALEELEELVSSEYIDVEFALTEDLVPYLLQVRPISTSSTWAPDITLDVDRSLEGIRRFVESRFCSVPGVLGNTTVLGQMPDWNPAEMIGRAPRVLAHSLYRSLITDKAWREAREEMGYRVPAGQPLMVSLAGQPYVDTRLSFHSYLPASLSSKIGEKLVDSWVGHLKENPHLHDKIEFEVAITTFSFDIDKKIEALTHNVLSQTEKAEYKEALRFQTMSLLSNSGAGSISAAIQRIENLETALNAKTDGKNVSDARLFEMIDSCIRFGTIPFSILARHGFIARTLLLSLKERGVFSEQDVTLLMASIQTVAGELVDDLAMWKNGEIEKAEFVSKYGHLRPGTYDILSPRYDQIADSFTSSKDANHPQMPDFALTAEQEQAINTLLTEEGFSDINAEYLVEYIKSATAGREFGKFVFSRSISDMLEHIADLGELHGLGREEMSHIPIGSILELAASSHTGDIATLLRATSEAEARKHRVCSAIRLPQVLFDAAGVYVVPFQVSHPNFITSNKVTAKAIPLGAGEIPMDLSGKIVLIESADPGFDWIFGHAIAGLITKYGGANSHMAIRCAEFGIPAAIGCGEQRYDALKTVDQIMLDCSSSIILTV